MKPKTSTPKEKKEKSRCASLKERFCAACGKFESDNLVDGQATLLRSDRNKNLICHDCPLVPEE